ncbi:MAG: ferritin-like domain-containing protein [Candidatus Eremiobacteraeota bacterium]|nr:ferritin-like domain-containing protein [Candidatus Eremiobacteraeota bacterium]
MDVNVHESFQETGELVHEISSRAREAKGRGVSRSAFLATATAGTAGVLASSGALGAVIPRQTTATCGCSAVDIYNIAATAELLAITMYYRSLVEPTDLPDVNSVANRNYFQAALTEEYIHYELLQSLGGKGLASHFYFPTTMFTSEPTFFNTLDALETAFVAAYLAAAKEFSGVVSSAITKANPLLIGAAVQIACVEGEHRALGRVASGSNPPNNRYLESGEFKCVSDAVAALKPFLAGGSGFSGPYTVPSKAQVNAMANPYGFSFFAPEPLA